MKQRNDDEEDSAPLPTLQRQTTTTAGKFDVLKHSIGSLKVDRKRKNAILKIIEEIEEDSKDMERALEESTLETALARVTSNAPEASDDPEDATGTSDAAADTAALVRTITGSSTKLELGKRTTSVARRRWHVAAAASSLTSGLKRTKTVA